MTIVKHGNRVINECPSCKCQFIPAEEDILTKKELVQQYSHYNDNSLYDLGRMTTKEVECPECGKTIRIYEKIDWLAHEMSMLQLDRLKYTIRKGAVEE